MANDSPRVLVVLDFSVGDIVMNHTLLSLLKQHEPNLEIDVIAPPMAQGLIERMPEVRKHFSLDVRSIRLLSRKWLKTCSDLRGEGYRQAILIPRSTSAAWLILFSKIKMRTGFKQVRPGLINDQRGGRPGNFHQKTTGLLPKKMSVPDRLPYPYLQANEREISETVGRFEMDISKKPLIVLAPGASRWSTKKWPIEHFVQLSRMLIEKYHVCVMGGDQEFGLGQVISAEHPQDITNLCGKSSISEAVDLIAAAECVVANDSGLMHVAAAVRTPIVGIYGPTSPEAYPPLSDSREIFWTGALCSPCYQDRCPYGHHACMRGITPQQVLGRVLKLIEKSESSAAEVGN